MGEVYECFPFQQNCFPTRIFFKKRDYFQSILLFFSFLPEWLEYHCAVSFVAHLPAMPKLLQVQYPGSSGKKSTVSKPVSSLTARTHYFALKLVTLVVRMWRYIKKMVFILNTILLLGICCIGNLWECVTCWLTSFCMTCKNLPRVIIIYQPILVLLG